MPEGGWGRMRRAGEEGAGAAWRGWRRVVIACTLGEELWVSFDTACSDQESAEGGEDIPMKGAG